MSKALTITFWVSLTWRNLIAQTRLLCPVSNFRFNVLASAMFDRPACTKAGALLAAQHGYQRNRKRRKVSVPLRTYCTPARDLQFNGPVAWKTNKLRTFRSIPKNVVHWEKCTSTKAGLAISTITLRTGDPDNGSRAGPTRKRCAYWW